MVKMLLMVYKNIFECFQMFFLYSQTPILVPMMREMMLDTIRDTRLIGPGASPELSWLVFLLSLVLDRELFDRRLHCLGGSMFGRELQSQMKSEKSGASLSLSSDD